VKKQIDPWIESVITMFKIRSLFYINNTFITKSITADLKTKFRVVLSSAYSKTNVIVKGTL